jgi:hypothetical protein
VKLGIYSASQIWHCTLGNRFDLVLDVGRIGTLWGIMSLYILPPFFLLQAICAGTCKETEVVIWSGFPDGVHMSKN